MILSCPTTDLALKRLQCREPSRAKNFPPKKNVEIVISVYEDILCQSMDSLSTPDKEVLLNVLAQYTAMKRQYATQEKIENSKSKKEKER